MTSHRSIRRVFFSISLAMSMFVTPALVRAQSQTQTPPDQTKTEEQKKEEEKKAKVSEEMTVTARKREETVQEVPISVAAPTASELRDRGAETIEDVANNVAGFTVQNLGPGQSQVAMRGVSSGQIVRDQPGVKEQVGVYLDESVISLSLFTPDLDLFDLQRVEVLRGPQGTLFGSGSESGTVRYITAQPILNQTESVAELEANTVENGGPGGSVKAAYNMPIGTTSAARLAAYYTHFGGFIDAVQPDLSIHNNVNDGYRAGARLSFLFKPTDAWSITPRIVYQKADMNGWNRIDVFNILGNPYTTTRPAVTLNKHEQFTQIGEPFTDKFLLGDLNAGYKLPGNAQLTSITSYTDRDVLVVRDAGALTSSITGGSIGLPPSVYTLDAPLNDATKAKVFTEEVRVAGASHQTWEWVAGAFFEHMKRHYAQSLPVNGFTQLSGIPSQGVYAPNDVLFWSDLNYNFHQYAAFGEVNYTVNPKLELTGGLRAYNYKEDRNQIFDGLFGSDANGKPQIQPGTAKANGVAPRAMANFKITDMSSLYGQISKGFRLGGINDPLNVNLCTPADLVTFGGHDSWNDETLWNYEVGSKNVVMNGRGSVNASVFYADIKNLQATVTAGSCSSRLVFNVPKAHSAGAEVEMNMAPTPVFDFSLSASHTDSKLDSTVTSTDSTGAVAVVSGIQKGARMPTVPENQAALSATYHWTASSAWAGYVTGTYQYVGDRYTQVGDEYLTCVTGTETAPCQQATMNLNSFGKNTIGGPLTQSTFTFDPKLPSYNLLNLRFGVLKGKWDTALFINNVTNETAYLSLDRERGFRARVAYLTNTPRTFGINTRVSF